MSIELLADIGRASRGAHGDDLRNEDCLFVNKKLGLYAVFDGASSKVASEYAATHFLSESEKRGDRLNEGLDDRFLRLHRSMMELRELVGACTAAMAVQVNDGGAVTWAQAGDCKLEFFRHESKKLRLRKPAPSRRFGFISNPRSHQRKGPLDFLGHNFYEYQNHAVPLIGELAATSNLDLILSSDGVPDNRSWRWRRKFGKIMKNANSAQIAANEIIEASPNDDDASVIVVRFRPETIAA